MTSSLSEQSDSLGNSCHFTIFEMYAGTGKTDVAVQIISNMYHNFPEQRTLIVTHSNQALNHLFEKIMALVILFRLLGPRIILLKSCIEIRKI